MRLPGIIVVLTTLLLGACNSSIGQPGRVAAPVGPYALRLPPPMALLDNAERSGAFTDADRHQPGAAYLPAPANLVAVNGQAAVYSPNFTSDAPGVSGLAYGAYLFDLPGYADSPLLTFAWNTAPADYGDVWVGVGNQQLDHWEWFSLPASNQLDFGSLTPYLSSDKLVLAVVLTGTAPAELREITIGEDAMPVADLTATPSSGLAPLTVSLSAAGSIDSDGSIVRYEFDLDGDGTFETDNGGVPGLNHDFATPGSLSPAVRVTDDKGATAEASTTVTVGSPGWLHTAGEDDEDQFTSIAVDGAGNVYVAGYTTDEALGRRKLVLTKWDADGNFVWGKTWTLPAGNTQATDIAVDSQGDIIVCGYYYPGNPFDLDKDAVLVKFDSSGQFLWATMYSSFSDDYFNSVCVDGTDIYVSGSSANFSSDQDLIVLRLTAGGVLSWTRRYYWFNEQTVDSALLQTPGGAVALYTLVSENNPALTQLFPLYVRYDLDGNFEADAALQTSGTQVLASSLAVSYDSGLSKAQLFIAAAEEATGTLVLLGTDQDRNVLFEAAHSSLGDLYPRCLLLDGTGGMVLAGSTGGLSVLWSCSASDGSISAAEGWENNGNLSQLYSAAWLNGNVIAAGVADDTTGTWQPLNPTQSSRSYTWSLGAGLSTSENLTLTDPSASDDIADWSSPQLDVDAGLNEGLVLYRAAP